MAKARTCKQREKRPEAELMEGRSVGRKGREGGKGWLENRSQQWKKENSRHKESSTQQVVRLAKYRSNFPSSNHTILVATSSSLLSSLPWEVVGKEERKASEKTKPNLQRSPCLPSLGNRYPCRTAKPSKAKIVTNSLFSNS